MAKQVHLPYAQGCQPDTVAAKEFSIGRTTYRVEIQPSKMPGGGFHWNAYRAVMKPWGTLGFERIPAMSRAQCDRFPKTVAKLATEFFDQYKTAP